MARAKAENGLTRRHGFWVHPAQPPAALAKTRHFLINGRDTMAKLLNAAHGFGVARRQCFEYPEPFRHGARVFLQQPFLPGDDLDASRRRVQSDQQPGIQFPRRDFHRHI